MDTFHWQGFGGYPSWCYLHLMEMGKEVWAVLTEPPYGQEAGTSITNDIENLATQVYRDRIRPAYGDRPVRWFEHYPHDGAGVEPGQPPIGGLGDRFDEVSLTFEPAEGGYIEPHWHPAEADVVRRILAATEPNFPWTVRLDANHHAGVR